MVRDWSRVAAYCEYNNHCGLQWLLCHTLLLNFCTVVYRKNQIKTQDRANPSEGRPVTVTAAGAVSSRLVRSSIAARHPRARRRTSFSRELWAYGSLVRQTLYIIIIIIIDRCITHEFPGQIIEYHMYNIIDLFVYIYT